MNMGMMIYIMSKRFEKTPTQIVAMFDDETIVPMVYDQAIYMERKNTEKNVLPTSLFECRNCRERS